MKTVFAGSAAVLKRELLAVDQVFKELGALKSRYEAPRHTRALSVQMNEGSDRGALDQLTNQLTLLEKQLSDCRKDQNSPEETQHKLSVEIVKLKSKILQVRSDLAIKVAKDNTSKANEKIEILHKHLELETQRSRSRTKLSFSRESSAERLPLSCDETREGSVEGRWKDSDRTVYNIEQEKEAMRKMWKLMQKRIEHSKQALQAKRLKLDQERAKLREERAALLRARQALQYI
jgi:hypothetical protein